MLILICLILLAVGVLTLQQIYRRYNLNLVYKLPGPPAIPIFGNALEFNDTYEVQWNTLRRYLAEYSTMCIWLFSDPEVFIRHPDDIKILIKSKSNIDKSHMFYSTITRYGNEGIITSGGTKWRERRRLMNQAFLRNTLRSTIESANKYAELIIQEILRGEDKSIVNVFPITMRYSLDIICDSAMGYDLHTIGAPYEKEYRIALEDFLDLIMYRAYRPCIKDWMANLLPIGKKIIRAKETIKVFSERAIEERRKYHKNNGINLLYDEFINGLNNADSGAKEVKSSYDFNLMDMLCIYNAKGLIDEHGMIEELETLVAAGTETTGVACSYILLLLAENEREQTLARKEVVDVMKMCGNKLTLDDLQNLQYLERCVKEALRLFPSVHMVGRKLVEDTQFTKYLVPRNTDVFMCIYDVQRDPQYWPEPTKFNPDRFLPENFKNQYPYTYLPFSGGLRSCIGQKHSIAEIKLLTAHILNNFYLESVEPTANIAMDMKVVLKPTNKILNVKFVKILQDK